MRVLQRLWELDKDRPDTLVEMATALAAQGLHGEAAARIVEYAEVLASRGQIEDSQQAYESVLRKAAEDHVLSPEIMRSYLRFCEKYQVCRPTVIRFSWHNEPFPAVTARIALGVHPQSLPNARGPLCRSAAA